MTIRYKGKVRIIDEDIKGIMDMEIDACRNRCKSYREFREKSSVIIRKYYLGEG